MGMLIGKLFVMLAMLLAATLLFALFPSITKAVAAEGATSKNMLRNFGLGLLVLIVTPVLILISFITGIGYFVALLMSFLYILAMMVSMVLAGLVFGRWMQKVVLKKSKADLNWGFALGGVAVLSLIALIPFVGWLICFFFFVLALGTRFLLNGTCFEILRRRRSNLVLESSMDQLTKASDSLLCRGFC